MAKARRGDISGPVLAILVTLILLAIGAAIIAYFTLFAGGVSQAILTVAGQPVAYKNDSDAIIEVIVVNTGNVNITLKSGSGGTNLTIVSPPALAKTLPLESSDVSIGIGESKVLVFKDSNAWNTWKGYRSANAVLKLVDVNGNTVGVIEVTIRIVAGR